MKRLSFLAFLSIMFVSVATAQPKSIGLRLGGNQELSYQHFVNLGDNMLQVDLGSYYFQGLQGTLTYNWYSHTNNPAFGVYYGFGAGAGFSWGDNDWYPKFWDKQDPNYDHRVFTTPANRRYWMFGVLGHFGVEYNFDIPLSISFDYRPMIGAEIGKRYYPNKNNPEYLKDPIAAEKKGETPEYSKKMKFSYHTPGLWAFAFSIRYTF